jgi:hypothetical protein
MPNARAQEVRTRFETVAAALTAANANYSVTVGLAEAQPGDNLHDLIAHADADLLLARRPRETTD